MDHRGRVDILAVRCFTAAQWDDFSGHDRPGGRHIVARVVGEAGLSRAVVAIEYISRVLPRPKVKASIYLSASKTW